MKQLILLGNKQTFRNKKNIFLFLALIFCTFIAMMSFEIKQNLTNYINNMKENNPDFRTIFISEDYQKLENKISNLEHVSFAGSSLYSKVTLKTDSYKNYNIDGIINFHLGIPNLMPEVVVGRNITENEKDVVICPLNFLPNSTLKTENIIFINYKELLNQNFTISYDSIILENGIYKKSSTNYKTLKLIGFYNNLSNQMTSNDCYIPFDNMDEIIIKTYPENENLTYNSMIIVDKTDHLELVRKKLNDLGYSTELKIVLHDEFINKINLGLTILIFLTVSTSVLVSMFFVYKKIFNNIKQVKLLLTLGFNKIQIVIYQIIEIVIICLFSLILSFVLYELTFYLINIFFSTALNLMGIHITKHYHLVAISILLNSFLPLFFSFLLNIFTLRSKKYYEFIENRKE